MPRFVPGGEKQGMDNLQPRNGGCTDSGTVKIGKREREVMNQLKTGESSSKLVGKKRRNVELKAKKFLKQWKKVKKSAAEKVAHSRTEMENMVVAADEKEKDVKLEKEKLDGVLAAMLLMLGTEHVLMQALFPPSGNC
ncbi:hypothetical protein SLE2022_038620 [Rubroshorea leprosula]